MTNRRIERDLLTFLFTLIALSGVGYECASVCAYTYPQSSTQTSRVSLPADPIEAFSFDSIDGETIEVSASAFGDKQLTVLCFLGTECPLAKLYANRIIRLSQEHNEIRFVGVFSNVQDSAEEIQTFANDNELSFEFGKDHSNVIADQLDVLRTPEVIVLDKDLTIRYRGRVDNQYLPGVARSKATSHELKDAIDELLAGKSVTVSQTEPEGCLLGRARKLSATDSDDSKNGAPTEQVTFANQIARVLQRNCVECHRTGEIGPFALTDYDEAIGWADMILEVVDNGRMPPWHASDEHAKFSNSRLMSDEDKRLLHQWVEQGTPMGDPKKLPPAYVATTGWNLPREPDQVIAMRNRPFTVPADGTVEYQYFVVDPKIEEDCWVSAAQVIPGNRAVVHHSIVFVRPPDGVAMNGVGWLAAYVPGQTPLKFSPKRARKIPAGSKFVFQQHYTPNGTEQTDTTKIGLVFAKEEDIEFEVLTALAINQNFEIKPEDPSHIVSAIVRGLPRRGELLSVAPHMHFRGKSFKSFLKFKDSKKTLVHVPQYDFNWQHRYQLADPVPLQDLAAVSIDVEFDNSKDNPFNPDPSQYVTWGDQTWEEMAMAFYDIAVPIDMGTGEAETEADESFVEPESKMSPADIAKIDAIEKKFFEQFDANDDNQIVRSELPRSTRNWGFRDLDFDRDGEISRDDIRRAATIRIRNQ